MFAGRYNFLKTQKMVKLDAAKSIFGYSLQIPSLNPFLASDEDLITI